MWMYIYIYCCCGCGVFLLLVLLFLWDIYTLVVLRVCCHCTSPGLVSDGVPRMVSFSAAATGIARAQHLRRISIQSAIWSPSKQYRIKYIFNVLILGQRTQIYSIFIQTQALYSNVMHSSFIRFHPIFSLPNESLIRRLALSRQAFSNPFSNICLADMSIYIWYTHIQTYSHNGHDKSKPIRTIPTMFAWSSPITNTHIDAARHVKPFITSISFGRMPLGVSKLYTTHAENIYACKKRRRDVPVTIYVVQSKTSHLLRKHHREQCSFVCFQLMVLLNSFVYITEGCKLN